MFAGGEQRCRKSQSGKVGAGGVPIPGVPEFPWPIFASVPLWTWVVDKGVSEALPSQQERKLGAAVGPGSGTRTGANDPL